MERMGNLARANVLGVGVHAINMEQAVAVIDQTVRDRRKGYVCVTGVHGVMEAQSDAEFKQILNNSLLTTPDGMPTVWVGRLQGFRQMDRVYGPDLMLEVCRLSEERGYTHFFYGGNHGVAEKLASALLLRYPKLNVVGMFTPPFRPLNPAEVNAFRERITEAQPDFVWVGSEHAEAGTFYGGAYRTAGLQVNAWCGGRIRYSHGGKERRARLGKTSGPAVAAPFAAGAEPALEALSN